MNFEEFKSNYIDELITCYRLGFYTISFDDFCFSFYSSRNQK